MFFFYFSMNLNIKESKTYLCNYYIHILIAVLHMFYDMQEARIRYIISKHTLMASGCFADQ